MNDLIMVSLEQTSTLLRLLADFLMVVNLVLTYKIGTILPYTNIESLYKKLDLNKKRKWLCFVCLLLAWIIVAIAIIIAIATSTINSSIVFTIAVWSGIAIINHFLIRNLNSSDESLKRMINIKEKIDQL